MQTLTKEYITSLLPMRPDNSHKATFGHVLNIAGSMHYRGAAYLSSLSALRTGAGYVTLASSPGVCQSVSALTPNIVMRPLPTRPVIYAELSPQMTDSVCIGLQSIDTESIDEKAVIQLHDLLEKASVITVGSGLSIGQSKDEFNDSTAPLSSMAIAEGNHCFFLALLGALQTRSQSMVFDADALNFISHFLHHSPRKPQTPLHLPKNSIITPHPKELARLLNIDVEAIQADRVHYATEAAKQLNTIVLLKGYHTVISDGEYAFINPTGNNALAKAGSGDVLTGIIGGFCAQGLSPLNATCLGVYLHGLAGDLAAQALSEYSVLASDLLDYIPKAIKQITNVKPINV
ncbi:NAD(P)H-hydrate dehydratase [Shewanella metallivivens]|uniref:ADP-dependent (S)-NAD(P)H-hydrate dehydratase n=1 Tax=Shewanella metallivivens TaxID=2872342 RepID=A0ABT5TI22_9GAMM|nr:NAD(P)H-hydrate dehydratase [Shewanella metallivivens]MDD8058255.1 NAD(P)H-hydrate dehydratase [Shewanella metallivivens]